MKDYKSKLWNDSPNLIRSFYESEQKYKNLCEEVEYILHKEIDKVGVEISSISSRSKSIDSFCEKINRKQYSNPFKEMTDFSGARIVYLYEEDKEILEHVIENNFVVIEKVDKISTDNVDRFGYGALHYIVQLTENFTGPRYEELYGLYCEIQVRTILQDAWAIVAHHLSYKQESDVPKPLRRKLNALSGLFETADDQFSSIRKKRVAYKASVQEDIKNEKDSSLNVEMEADNLTAYLQVKYPDISDNNESSVVELLGDLKRCGYITLSELDDLMERSATAVRNYEKAHPPYDPVTDKHTKYKSVGLVRTALGITSDEYFEKFSDDSMRVRQKEKMTKFRKVVQTKDT
ncbi:TPA: hypothetical protein P0E15_005110 [Vibrio harveyi]|nr:hypothetical protein [Vibrio harveyi]